MGDREARFAALLRGESVSCLDCGAKIKNPWKCNSCWAAYPRPVKAPKEEEVAQKDSSVVSGVDFSVTETVSGTDIPEGATMANEKLSKEDQEQAEKFRDVKLARFGDQITLPHGMTIKTAMKWLARMEEADLATVEVDESFTCDPFEGAVALVYTLKEKYGWVDCTAQTVMGMFGPMKIPPKVINVPVAHNETIGVPWGALEVPGIRGNLVPAIGVKDNRPVFHLNGEVKQGDMPQVREICDLLKKNLVTKSIYRNKAFKLKFPQNPQRASLEDFMPEFMDTKRVNRHELILNREIDQIVTHSVFTPILKTDRLRRENIPRKRGILLAGKFGVGKTLTAAIVARLCEENGWTYITIDDPSHLAKAIEFAQRFPPSVVFCEDVDRALRGERTQEMDAILNTIDGIKAKNNEVMVILTTNELEKINQAMIRPGRIDVVIPVAPPDADAVQRLFRLYAKNKDGASLLDPTADLSAAGKRLEGSIPAVVREVVERSKLAAISRLDDADPLHLTGEDLLAAAIELEGHNKLLAETPADNRTELEKFGDVIGQHLRMGLENLQSDSPETLNAASAPGLAVRTAKNGTARTNS